MGACSIHRHLTFIDAFTDCGGNFTARYGIIKSPNWPEHYGDGENCTWIIRAPLDQTIELVVHNFTTEVSYDDESCDDYLEIR